MEQSQLTTQRENVLFMTEGAMMENAAIHKPRASAASKEPHVSFAGMRGRCRGLVLGIHAAFRKGLLAAA